MEENSAKKPGLLAKFKLAFSRRDDIERSADIASYEYSESLSTTALTGNGKVGARTRQLIYQKYQEMMADPLVSGALRLHVTAALGGHETSGDTVFIETVAEMKGNKQAESVVADLIKDLSPIFNRIAMQVAYNATGFGDGYARLYPIKGKGVVEVIVDEMVIPPLVIPYEQANTTAAYQVAIGPRVRQRLNFDQMARAKMPRMIYTPQPIAIEKAYKVAVLEDDPTKLPLMPSLVGGSFLADAESQYNNYVAAMAGLVGQRVLDSIDESIFTAEMAGMTREQQQRFGNSIKRMLKRSKELADEVVTNGRPLLTRIRHFLPVANQKQVMSVQALNSQGGSGSGRAGNIGIEDVMFHAKLLCGALGIDISMLGFADIMSGGLGEGGFFRTSAQSAERARTIRIALIEFFNHIVDIHLTYKTGYTFEPGNRPWSINFYGTISALETERQKTALDAAQTGSTYLQAFQMAKELGWDAPALALLLEKVFKIDSKDAEVYAAATVKAKKDADALQQQQSGFGGGGGGGGDGGGGDGGLPFADPEEEEPPPSFGKAKAAPVGKK